MLKLVLSIAAVVVTTVIVGIFVSALTIPQAKLPPNSQAGLQARNARLDVIFRNPQATLRQCGLSLPSGTGVVEASHATLVRVARCLERRGLITRRERRSIEADTTLRLSASFTLPASEGHGGWAWEVVVVLVWAAGLVAIGVLIYRYRKSRRE